jgi:ComF family protein
MANGVACRACWASTRFFDGNEMLCDRCGAFFGDKTAPVPVHCRKCDDHHYDKAAAAGIYEKGFAAVIVELKRVPAMPEQLKFAIRNSYLPDAFSTVDLVVPIPLSKHRRVERGFNQADIVAASVAKRLNVPVDTQSLSRRLHTPIHRVGMDQKARELSVKNAFEVHRPKLIQGKNVLLVDDILTSGATASNAAKVLKKTGAKKVFVFTLARAVMD